MQEGSEKAIPFEKHPLYEEAMQQIVAGDREGALASLSRLTKHYPDEPFLQELLVRVQLQSTFRGGEYIPVEHSQGTPVLRTVVLIMLAITTCLVIATGLIAVYFNYFKEFQDNEAIALEVQRLWDDVDKYMEAGDLVRVLEILDELERLTGNSAKIQEARVEVQRLQWCSETYTDGVALRERGDWGAAEDRLLQIPDTCSQYEDAQVLIRDLQKQGEVETAWAEAQDFLEVDDCSSAITTLTWVRDNHPNYRRVQVQDLLFQCHRRLALELLDSARGDVGAVQEAVTHLDAALKIKPTDQELVAESRLANGYVAGHQAYDLGDWSIAVVRWEPLYAMRPDYQQGALEQKLSDSYPRAAMQSISEANGSRRLLLLAIDHLEQALLRDPENEALSEEKGFAEEYLVGLDAFEKEDWDLAIAYWGPIQVARPDYQNGVLGEKMRQACAVSTAPNEQYCTP